MFDLITLHEAYKCGDLRAVKTLLGNPHDFANARGPLAVLALLELGADPNYGDNALLAALATDRTDRYEIVELLLAFGALIQQRGINDYTPLHYAAAMNDLRMIKPLLAHGADPPARAAIDEFSAPTEEAENRKFSEAAQALKEVDRERLPQRA